MGSCPAEEARSPRRIERPGNELGSPIIGTDQARRASGGPRQRAMADPILGWSALLGGEVTDRSEKEGIAKPVLVEMGLRSD
jgi:hypothetical protein